MAEMSLKQLRLENDACKKLLESLMEENIQLKLRLSEVLKKSNINLLYKLELFQTEFINKDVLISILRNDVSELDRLLTSGSLEDGTLLEDTGRQLMNLKLHLEVVEKKCGGLKAEFFSFLQETISFESGT